MKLSENSIIDTCKKFTELLDGYMSEVGILNEDGILNLNNYLFYIKGLCIEGWPNVQWVFKFRTSLVFKW